MLIRFTAFIRFTVYSLRGLDCELADILGLFDKGTWYAG